MTPSAFHARGSSRLAIARSSSRLGWSLAWVVKHANKEMSMKVAAMRMAPPLRVCVWSRVPPAPPPAPPSPLGAGVMLALYNDNGNGTITCAEARRHGIVPVLRSHPAYRYMRDADGDGVVCE